MELPILNFAEKYDFQLKENNSLWYIFDEIRKKWILLTPEEWVRQHLIKFFKTEKKIPNSSIVIEKKLVLNHQTKRLDILLVNKANPWVLVECKAPEIQINQSVFEQAARYNTQIMARYILLSNGLTHIYFEYDRIKNVYSPVDDFTF